MLVKGPAFALYIVLRFQRLGFSRILRRIHISVSPVTCHPSPVTRHQLPVMPVLPKFTKSQQFHQ